MAGLTRRDHAFSIGHCALLGIALAGALTALSGCKEPPAPSSGAARSAEAGWQITFGPKDDEDASILQARDGTLYLAWFTPVPGGAHNLFIKTSRDAAQWTAPVRAIVSAEKDWYPTLLQDHAGLFHMTWMRDSRGVRNVWYSRSHDGLAWQPARALTDERTADWAPVLSEDRAGRLWIVWVSQRTGNRELFVMFSDDRGGSWSTPQQITHDPGEDDLPFLAQRADGTYALVWSRYDGREGQNWVTNHTADILSASSPDGLTWSAPRYITHDPPAQPHLDSLPSLFRDAQGTDYVIWTTTRMVPGGRTGHNVYLPLDAAAPGVVPVIASEGFLPRVILADHGWNLLVWTARSRQPGRKNRDVFARWLSP